MCPKEIDYKKYHLKSGIYVFCDENHKFGTDAVCLAHFAYPKNEKNILDLGTGCGIIPLIWRAVGFKGGIKAVDIQNTAIKLCNLANSQDELKHKIDFLLCDLKEYKKIGASSYKLITMNPPYKKINDGVQSPKSNKVIANHEVLCNLNDICFSASKLLEYGGRFCMCQRPSRLNEIFQSFNSNKIEPKRIRFVHQNINSKPSLVLIEGRFGGSSGLVVERPLFLENEDKSPSDEMKLILQECYEIRGEQIG